ncbi:MAG: EthD domain-containing protein [Alphaproteobacteria bacterium]
MFKTVCLLKRRAGMSFEDFQAYYETHHRKIGEKVLPHDVRYMRRYLHPVPNPVTGESPELEFDVLTEMWFDTQEAFDAAMAALGEPEIAAEIAEDEEKLFDRSKIRFCTIEEHESAMG